MGMFVSALLKHKSPLFFNCFSYCKVEGDSLWIKVKTDPEILRYIVPKGFIAIDGTSLTVCDVNASENWFTFMLIEYTQKKIIVPQKPVGGLVNLEVDVLVSNLYFISDISHISIV